MTKITPATEKQINSEMHQAQDALDKLDDLGYDENLDSQAAIDAAEKLRDAASKIFFLLSQS